jgi:hypothetical protein
MFINKLNKFFIWRALVPKKIRTIIWKRVLRKSIILFFKNDTNEEIKKVIDFLNKNP